MKCIDLTGQTFGRLTVIERAANYVSPGGTKVAQWLCECNCKDKNIVIVPGRSLRNGLTKSCGCLKIECQRERLLKRNNYSLSGDFGIGYTFKNEEFYFDLEDYDKIKNYCWRIDNAGYVVSKDIDKKFVSLHKLILPDSIYVDHINHKKYDNRKCNLRAATPSQNNMNKSIKSNNKSGVPGVNWHKLREKWRAFIVINGKHIHLGLFTNFEDAVHARKAAEEKYFGEWSYDNSITKKG